MSKKTAIIIGAGPGGLTATKELIDKSDITPIIFEATADIGGISKTVNYKGNKIDIGGHRFFSKSDVIVKWWKNILPFEEDIIDNKKHSTKNIPDKIMLSRNRLSRIFFLKKFFDYPISLSKNTLLNLGLIRTTKIGFSYLKVKIFPIKKENNLEDFYINRFGRELYNTFFKDYTEKVWGVPCSEISSEWGAQRIKGLSITKTVLHAMKSAFSSKKSTSQKNIETSLIGKFMYPKFGPGQLWEEVAHIVKNKGAEIKMNSIVEKINVENGSIVSVGVKDLITNEQKTYKADYFISTMPVKDLVNSLSSHVPEDIKKIANGLMYRDFITVGLLVKKTAYNFPDNWIYIQDRNVKLGRLQIFNNWSPYMVKDPENTVWIGLEYFANEGDELWSMNEKDFANFAISEIEQVGIIKKEDVLDYTVIKMPKAYPSYFGSYNEFDKVSKYLNKFENLFLIGRNGMHRYNNQDHSMLTAIVAVDNIIKNIKTKNNIWEVNTEKDYHEEKTK